MHQLGPGPHTVQSDTTRCGVSRVGHVAKRPRLYRSDNDFAFAQWQAREVAIVKKRKKLNKERKERLGGELFSGKQICTGDANRFLP